MENDTPNKIKISKEIIATLPIETFPGKIVVIDNERDADNAVLQLNNESIIGFDTETRPTFKKGKSNHVALIQLSTHDTCYLFRINRIGFTPAIKNLLENESLLKVGISLKDDFCMLNRLNSGQFIPRNFIELQKFVKKYNIEDQSLQKIYGIVIGKKISKGQRLSNWEADHLTENQQLYAATDAWSCIKIYEVLKSGKFKRYDIIALLLVIYLAVMAYFGRGMLLSGNYWEYFSIIGVTLLVIFILRWAMKRREKIREERRKKQDASERRTLRNDNIS